MINKLFALASVSALSGFVVTTAAAGCSSSEVVTQPGETLPGDGGKKDARPPPPREEEEAESCKAKITFTAEETKPPAPQSGTACSEEVIEALAEGCAEDPGGEDCTKARELPANQTCASCIFGSKTDEQWKVINLMPGETPSARYNQEVCVEHITGVPGCGQAYLRILDCFNSYCADCPDRDVQACLEDTAEAECLEHRIADQKCANAITAKDDAINGCFPAGTDPASIKALFANMARVSCATAPAGGQTDGGG